MCVCERQGERGRKEGYMVFSFFWREWFCSSKSSLYLLLQKIKHINQNFRKRSGKTYTERNVRTEITERQKSTDRDYRQTNVQRLQTDRNVQREITVDSVHCSLGQMRKMCVRRL